jgi:hypothetical protein
MRCRILYVLFVTCIATSLSGCSAFRNVSRVLFTNASVADLELEGVAAGPCVPVAASVVGSLTTDPRAAALGPILAALGVADPIGCVLQIERIGEYRPFFVLCGAQGGFEAKCRAIPLHAKVHVSGSPVGPGGMLIPTRVTAAGFND